MRHMTYQTKKVWKRTAYTAMVVVVTVVLSHIPVYGIDTSVLEALFGQVSLLGFSDALSGGALSRLAIGGFGVTSIIMAGIIMQLLAVIFPSIEKARSDGELGRIRFRRITFMLAMLFTFLLSVGIASSNAFGIYPPDSGIGIRLLSVIEWMAGTAVIVALAQSIEQKGIGNGPTVILSANIAQRIPVEIANASAYGVDASGAIVMGVVLVVCIVLAVFLQGGSLHVTIQQTRKAVSTMNAEGFLPIPVAMSNVLPIVYATSIVMLPTLVRMFVGEGNGALDMVADAFTSANWYSPTEWYHVVGLIVFVLLIWFTGAYSSKIAFSSAEVANRMRERGDVIPNVAPGADTEAFLEERRRRLYRIGNVMLVFVAVVPDLVLARFGMSSMSFMGISLIILMAAFWDMRLRFTGLTKHWNPRYRLFGKED